MGTDFLIVLTTFPLDRDADQLARTLVGERLAACVNILPAMRSIYTWKGTVEEADERQILIKTTKERFRELESRLRELHPYETPELLAIPVLQGSHDYLAWVRDSTIK